MDKLVIGMVLIVCQCFVFWGIIPDYTFTHDFLLAQLIHANWWHLLLNLYCLLLIPYAAYPQLNLWQQCFVCFIVSSISFALAGYPVVGASAYIFAWCGFVIAKYPTKRNIGIIIPTLAVTSLLPHIAGVVHLISFGIALFVALSLRWLGRRRYDC